VAFSCLQEGDRVVMVQEYADGGDLFNLLQKYGGCLSERIAVQMVLDPFLRVLQVRNMHGGGSEVPAQHGTCCDVCSVLSAV
jgi:hypothetical protein